MPWALEEAAGGAVVDDDDASAEVVTVDALMDSDFMNTGAPAELEDDGILEAHGDTL